NDPMTSYGMGGVYFMNFDQGPSKWQIYNSGLNKAKSVQSPSQFLIIADSGNDHYNDLDISAVDDTVFHWGVAAVHHGGANALFLDGHVEWRIQSDLICTWEPVPQEAWKQRLWNYD